LFYCDILSKLAKVYNEAIPMEMIIQDLRRLCVKELLSSG